MGRACPLRRFRCRTTCRESELECPTRGRELCGVARLRWPVSGRSPSSPLLGPRRVRAPAGTRRLSRARLPWSKRRVHYRAVRCVRTGPAAAFRSGPARKVVALSFDDGPVPLTPQFVRMLSANRAVATFFMIGRQVTSSYLSTLHAELREGDALGDHTWSHPDLLLSGEVRSQLEQTLEAIRRLSGYTPCVFRLPMAPTMRRSFRPRGRWGWPRSCGTSIRRTMRSPE